MRAVRLQECQNVPTNVKPAESDKEKARAAAEKAASMGEDMDLKTFTTEAEPHRYQDDPSTLPLATTEQDARGRHYRGKPGTAHRHLSYRLTILPFTIPLNKKASRSWRSARP